MDTKEYINESSRTVSPNFYPENINKDTLHAAIGICTEAGELNDACKRTLFYGHLLDKVNLKEEIGDLMWYIALLCRSEDFNLEEIMDENINKLKIRYPDKFTNQAASERIDKQ